jgi:DNA replication protein DnaC
MALENIKGSLAMDEIRARVEQKTGRKLHLTGSPRVTEAELIERCRKADAEHRVARAMKFSEIGERFKTRTFETFQEMPGNAKALRAARAVMARGFTGGLGLHGVPGVGKTHLSAAIANAAMAAEKRAVCISVATRLAKIKASYHDGLQTSDKLATEAGIVKECVNAAVLVFDDLGKEQPLTAWALGMLYSIVNARYEANRPLIVTANLDLPALIAHYSKPFDGVDPNTGAALMDRIVEMTGLPWLKITGTSRRLIQGMQNDG